MRPGLLAALLLAAVTSAAGDGVRIGEVVPDFDASSLDGATLSLGAAVHTHEAVVVLFLSSVCPYARYFSSYIAELDRKYRTRGVLFVGVNSNQFESAEDTLRYA